ncbi:2-dehydropantoate 2-reductase [Bauldia litoralis]|uniref:2-dehydropantoate 2-reductase n=1 Tax=Bauldia litoralis TaxID=665467 RepID=A0A1G6AA14_9HYPH|nr:2-dehydropantoate 2-reductase [Bauldia litoralis]SDB04873.1 2-dehydropantoate 2-reductase [Bauldia litoralis]
MRLCVFGAGAIGGYLAARLATVEGIDLSLVARGPHLAAIKADGLRLIEDGAESVHRITASADAAELGPQDCVILCLKAHSISPALDAIMPLIGPETVVVTAQNGVPWWYFYRAGGALEGTRIEAVDPGGRIWDRIGPERAIGCVVYPAAEVDAPGVVRHVEGVRFPLGEPSGEKTERIAAISRILVAAGLKAPVRGDIRSDIWVKLWGNLAFNPISALTGGTLVGLYDDPGTRAVARAMMVEAQAIGEKLGVKFPVDVDRRIEGAGAVGAHKTSMLQDLELGRPMEIDALVTAVQELGRLVDVPTPSIDSVLALVRHLAATRGC